MAKNDKIHSLLPNIPGGWSVVEEDDEPKEGGYYYEWMLPPPVRPFEAAEREHSRKVLLAMLNEKGKITFENICDPPPPEPEKPLPRRAICLD